jgi:hypothetical protein
MAQREIYKYLGSILMVKTTDRVTLYKVFLLCKM